MRITKYNIEVGKDCKAVLVKENSRNCTAVDNLNSPQKVRLHWMRCSGLHIRQRNMYTSSRSPQSQTDRSF